MADLNKMIKLSPHEIELLDKINGLLQSDENIESEIAAIKTELEGMGSKIIISDTEPENPSEDMIWIDTSEGFDIDKVYLRVSGGTMTGRLIATNGIDLATASGSPTGIAFYSESDPTQIYLANASDPTSTKGVGGDLISPLGINVTKWAIRTVVKAEEGYGWTWEAITDDSKAPAIVAELSAIGGNFRTAGTISGSQVFNANANDYAEFFPRKDKEDTEVGDIIALDINEKEEVYRKATDEDRCIVGVHSECFGHIIGGEEPTEGHDFFSHNIKTHIPVALAGRCPVKVAGKVRKGDAIVPSNIPGVGRAMYITDKDIRKVIGYLVEADDKVDIRLLKIKIK